MFGSRATWTWSLCWKSPSPGPALSPHSALLHKVPPATSFQSPPGYWMPLAFFPFLAGHCLEGLCVLSSVHNTNHRTTETWPGLLHCPSHTGRHLINISGLLGKLDLKRCQCSRKRDTGEKPTKLLVGSSFPSAVPSHPNLWNQTYLGMGTRISVPSTSGFRFIPLSLIALTAAAVHWKPDQKVNRISK